MIQSIWLGWRGRTLLEWELLGGALVSLGMIVIGLMDHAP
jgi:hypothetical protein